MSALSQSDYGVSYGAAMAIDGATNSQWVSKKQYGGKTRENPADVWLGINLPDGTRFKGVKILGDDREMMPVQKKFKIHLRKGDKLLELKEFTIIADPKVKNAYEVHFNEDQTGDGIMIFFDKDELPKSDLQDKMAW